MFFLNKKNKFVLFLLLNISPLIGYAGNEKVMNKAMAILKQVDQGNGRDLDFLWSKLEPYCEKSSVSQFELQKELWISQLKQDQEVFQILKNWLGTNGTYPLRSSLNKLVGTEEITGILQDSIDLLNSVHDCYSLKPKNISLLVSDCENKLTVFKTTLLYANLMLKTLSWSESQDQLNIAYPESFPSSVSIDIDYMPLLCGYSQNTSGLMEIIIPNRGFIFGGNFFGDQCRGVDASAFTSYCVESTKRLSTWHLELLYKLLDGVETDDPTVNCIKDEYSIVKHREDISQGDLIFWRKEGPLFGHVAIFKKWLRADDSSKMSERFIGIDATRSDDKIFEGINVRKFNFNRPEFKTYVLRKKINFNSTDTYKE